MVRASLERAVVSARGDHILLRGALAEGLSNAGADVDADLTSIVFADLEAVDNGLWCGAVRRGVARSGAEWRGVARSGAVRCGAVRCGAVWCGVVWCGVAWCGVAWCGVL